MLDVALICLRSRFICFNDPPMDHSAMWLFFRASPRRFFTSSRWRRHPAVGNCDGFAWVVLFSLNSLIFMDQSIPFNETLMYFKAIFSSLGITSWNKLLNGRMVASRLRSLPQSWLLNLPRRNCWLRKTPKWRYQICWVTHNSMGFPPSSWISHWRWWSWRGFL